MRIFKILKYLLHFNRPNSVILRKHFYSTSRFNNVSTSYDQLNQKLHGKSLIQYISHLEKEYQYLSNPTNKRLESRKRELEPFIYALNERNKIVDDLQKLKELIDGSSDSDLKKLAEQERLDLEAKIKKTEENLLLTLIPKDKEDAFDSLVLEVQAGVGGQEAMLFAKEIFDMYQKFAAYKGWKHTIAEYLSTDLGGIRGATALISGTSAFQHLKHEAGIHRVQRIPATERVGRIHTSTISVIVLPQPSDIEINIDPKDLKIEVKRASGPGGQHVNKTESAVRIHHLPTGISVECQEDRSQIKNKKIAMAKLSALLYEKQLSVQQAEESASRKSQVKTKNRNEKIRTYNFKDDRVTDHRIGINCYNIKRFFEGEDNLNNLIEQLDQKYKLDSLVQVVNIIE